MAELVESIIRVVKTGPPLRLAVLFGSVAAGRSHAASDVDVAILPCDPELSLHDELALQEHLATVSGRRVDLVRIDRSPALLRWEIARTGKLLFAEPSWEWTRFRAREASAHADIGDAMERYTRMFLKHLARPRR